MEQRSGTEARSGAADVVLPAIPQGVTSLKSGALSVVLHVPYESAGTAFRIHEMQGKSVRVEIYLES